ncbi:MAG TPA: glycosyltransferase family 1 protein [Sedimentibacter sp.]|nr:glycosyltransferase family 1 protein [Sedimentibacter sp.]
MRIGIDCFKLIKGQGKSIGIYNVAKIIVQEMAKNTKDHEIIIFGNHWNRKDFDMPTIQFITVSINAKDKKKCIYWELIGVNKYSNSYHLDTILFPRGYMPLFKPVRSVIVVHDLIPFYYHRYYAKTFNKLENFYIMIRLKGSIKRADEIITISDYSRMEIYKLMPELKTNVHMIWNGVQTFQELDKINVTRKYILGITSELPHKNAIGMIKSYLIFCKKYGPILDLVLVGVESIEEFAVIVPLDIRQYIRCEKFLKDEEYMTLFKNAHMLLFLSIIEGFGLPLIEAMQLEVPVIVSNCACLPEIMGDAGILVDVDDYENIANQMYILSTDNKRREYLIKKGIERVKLFKGNKQVEEYYNIIEG